MCVRMAIGVACEMCLRPIGSFYPPPDGVFENRRQYTRNASPTDRPADARLLYRMSAPASNAPANADALTDGDARALDRAVKPLLQQKRKAGWTSEQQVELLRPRAWS